MYILRCLFSLSLRKHWHSSCWFLTFVDRDLILSNILQWFSCTSAAGLRWLDMGRALKVVATTQARSSRPAAAQTQTAAILATIHHNTHTHTYTPLHTTHTQPKSFGCTLDCYQITVFLPSVTPSLLTTVIDTLRNIVFSQNTNITYFFLSLQVQDSCRREKTNIIF